MTEICRGSKTDTLDHEASNPAAPFVFDTNSRRFYHGTKANLKPGDLLQRWPPNQMTQRSTRARSAVAALALCLAACGAVSDDQALHEFKAAFPDVTVEQQFVGDGDSDHARMHFVYTTPTGARLERVWLYQRQKDNSWRAIHKSEPKSPGSDFGD